MSSRSSRGFSLTELLITVAVLGILAAIGTVTTSHVVGKARDQKLFSDVSTLNRSIVAYLASGGDLSGVTRPEDVLVRLKRGFAQAKRVPGLSGAKLDERLTFTMQSPGEAQGNQWRAYWNAAEQRFVLAQNGEGPGIKAFRLEALPPASDPGEESLPEAKVPLLYAGSSTWIWDYQDAAPSGPPLPTDFPVGEVPNSPPPPPTGSPSPSGATPLAAPVFSLTSGAFPIDAFDLPLSLHNPNPLGSSELYYSINFGNWQLYTGPLQVPPGTIVAAQAIATSDQYRNSPRVDHRYGALPGVLEPPLITSSLPEFGLFTGREIEVTLTDLNSASISSLEYRVGNGPWLPYHGPFTLDRSQYPEGAHIEARAVALGEYHETSSVSEHHLGVERPVISGQSKGSFSNPTGDRNMLTNLAPGASSDYFAWGRDYLLPGENVDANTRSQLKQSSLKFDGLNFNDLTSGERFEIGTLTYFNGTILSDTGANSISFTTDLNFIMNGVAVATSFAFEFELINVANQYNPNNLWADADYVRLASPTASELLNFNGILYKFQLEFGESSAAGVALFDEFHVLEGRSATTKLYGTLIEVGTVSFQN